MSHTKTELRHFLNFLAKSHLAASAGNIVSHLTRMYLEALLSQSVYAAFLPTRSFTTD
jgi:hypothetical protein